MNKIHFLGDDTFRTDKAMLVNLNKGLVCLLILSLSAPALPDISAQVIDRGKRATALIVLDNERGFASAFCIDPTGIFVTNNHVLASSPKLQLVLSSGEKEQDILSATIIRQDKDSDIAVLKVDRKALFTSLTLAGGVGLSEAIEIAAFGYPFGKDLAIGMGQFPSVTVSLGHITSLRKFNGALKQIQVDASLNPGNSGGPVLNAQGQVIGIVASGIQGTGINFAIPVTILNALFDKPDIVFSPTDLSLEKQQQEHEFTVQILSNETIKAGTSIDLILSAGVGDKRIYPMQSQDGQLFRVPAVPLPLESANTLLIRARIGIKEVICRVKDQPIVVGGERTRLRVMRRIEGGRNLTTTGGQTLTGAIRGLDSVETRVDGEPTHLNLAKADVVTIEILDPNQESAEYTVILRRDGKVVNEQTGVFGKLSVHPSSPQSNATGTPTGKWTVEYKNGVIGTYEFLGNGLVQWKETERTAIGRIYLRNGKLIIDYPDDRLERISYVGQRLYVKHWIPKDRFPVDPPVAVGYAVRVN